MARPSGMILFLALEILYLNLKGMKWQKAGKKA
jgi:hypothetical protein